LFAGRFAAVARVAGIKGKPAATWRRGCGIAL